MELILVFSTTNHSVQAETVLLAGGLTVSVMPLPSAILDGCGLSIRISPDEYGRATALLKAGNVPLEGCYVRELEHGVSRYRPYDTVPVSE